LAVMLTTFYIGFIDNRENLRRDASERAQYTAVALVNDIAGLLRGVAQATRTLGAVVGQVRLDPDQTRAMLRSLLATDPAIYGAAIAYAPDAYPGGADFAAYMHRVGDAFRYLDIAAQQPGFRDQPWYREPALSGGEHWSEPYLDRDLGGIDMVTLSIPVQATLGGAPRLVAVVTADIALEVLRQRIREKVEDLDVERKLPVRVLLLSAEGRLISSERLHEQLPALQRDSSGVFTLPLAEQAALRGFEELRVLAARMAQGETASQVLVGLDGQTREWMHFRPLSATRWSVGVIVEEASLLADIEAAERRELALLALNLLLVTLVIVVLARRITGPLRALAQAALQIGHDPLAKVEVPRAGADEVGALGAALARMQVDLGDYLEQLKSTRDAKQLLEGELSAARQIQMAMLPRLPAGGSLVEGCEVAATLVPAKAVGGDLFDLQALADGRLFFLVADVSDKGAAAALFMAKTMTVADLLGRDGTDPAPLLEQLNNELCRDNDACMFVTAVCGLFDPGSGELRYSNAGHNPPLRVAADGGASYLELPPGGALGLYDGREYREQRCVLAPGETLLLYTDGVTEANDTALELYGEERLQALLERPRASAAATVADVLASVVAFAGTAVQADDITVVALRRSAPAGTRHGYRMRGGVEALHEVAAWLDATLGAAGV
ncbi:MAG TPA: SpoIIE family protein phosphatase, partial [Gammaproteobacteria bacterium]